MLLFLQEEKEEIAAETQVILAAALTLRRPPPSLGKLARGGHSQDSGGLRAARPPRTDRSLHIRLRPKFLHLCLVLPSKSINYLKRGKEKQRPPALRPSHCVC